MSNVAGLSQAFKFNSWRGGLVHDGVKLPRYPNTSKLYDPHAPVQKVPTGTLDSTLKALKWPKFTHFFSLDAEGAEQLILQGECDDGSGVFCGFRHCISSRAQPGRGGVRCAHCGVIPSKGRAEAHQTRLRQDAFHKKSQRV